MPKVIHLENLKLLISLVNVGVIIELPRWLSGKGDAFLFFEVFFLNIILI